MNERRNPQERPLSPSINVLVPAEKPHASNLLKRSRQTDGSKAQEFFGGKKLISKWEAIGCGKTKKILKIKPKEGFEE
jgi:hypothetical protein